MSVSWRLVEREATPAELVCDLPSTDGRRLACLCWPSAPALVLGSAQRPEVVDRARLDAAGVALVRRRSGGGAVVVAPGAQVWLDVHVPAGDHLLSVDVGRNAWWLGELWAGAIASVWPEARQELAVHRGGLLTRRWSRLVCFSGLGPGEVTRGDQKVVGISQRRGSSGAWLHSMALTSSDPEGLAGMLELPEKDRVSVADELVRSAGTVPVAPELLAAALRSSLSSATCRVALDGRYGTTR